MFSNVEENIKNKSINISVTNGSVHQANTPCWILGFFFLKNNRELKKNKSKFSIKIELNNPVINELNIHTGYFYFNKKNERKRIDK